MHASHRHNFAKEDLDYGGQGRMCALPWGGREKEGGGGQQGGRRGGVVLI